MRKGFGIAAFAGLLLAGAASASAQDFGLGIIVGEPTGISWKAWTGARSGLAGALAWSLGDRRDRLQIQVDYIVQNSMHARRGRLSWYFGLGGRVITRSNEDARFGMRVPLGLDYVFPRAPLNFFVEVVPIMNLVPATDLDLAAGVGLRYVF